jgi:hypothetical protein
VVRSASNHSQVHSSSASAVRLGTANATPCILGIERVQALRAGVAGIIPPSSDLPFGAFDNGDGYVGRHTIHAAAGIKGVGKAMM